MLSACERCIHEAPPASRRARGALPRPAAAQDRDFTSDPFAARAGGRVSVAFTFRDPARSIRPHVRRARGRVGRRPRHAHGVHGGGPPEPRAARRPVLPATLRWREGGTTRRMTTRLYVHRRSPAAGVAHSARRRRSKTRRALRPPRAAARAGAGGVGVGARRLARHTARPRDGGDERAGDLHRRRPALLDRSRVVGPSMLTLDGAEHRRHRAPFAPPFPAGRGARPLPRHGRRGDRAADRRVRARGGRPSCGGSFAGPLAAAVVMHALGLRGTPPEVVLGWYDGIVEGRRRAHQGPAAERARGRTWFAALRDALRARRSTATRPTPSSPRSRTTPPGSSVTRSCRTRRCSCSAASRRRRG